MLDHDMISYFCIVKEVCIKVGCGKRDILFQLEREEGQRDVYALKRYKAGKKDERVKRISRGNCKLHCM